MYYVLCIINKVMFINRLCSFKNRLYIFIVIKICYSQKIIKGMFEFPENGMRIRVVLNRLIWRSCYYIPAW